jgi:hypothetical protein
VDDEGNYSKTNSASVTYVVFAPMTVHTNGEGTVTPNYDGEMLQIGSTYSMTGKSPVRGFGLQTWTDGSNNVVTNKATVKFVMASNLVLTANFGDVMPPNLRVTAGVTNSNGDPNSIILFGKASDNVAVAVVSYRINDSAVISAPQSSTTNGWNSWAVVINNLFPGQNTISIFATDTSSNNSAAVPVTVQNDTAPNKLANRSAVVAPSDSTSYSIAFGNKTFSQSSADTNHLNAVGKYSYQASGGNASLKINYTAPQGAAAEDTRAFKLTFLTPATALYSTTIVVETNVVTVDTNVVPSVTNSYATNLTMTNFGYMYFDRAPQLAPSKLAYQLYYFIDKNATNGFGSLFEKKTFDAYSLLSPETSAGKFKYTRYSPLSGLIKLTETNGTGYIIVNYASTNDGTYHSENYDNSGNTNNTGAGRFLISSQQAGGNAPASVTNQSFQIFSGSENFNVTLGADTYSQATTSTNFDNAVGSYSYSRPETNIGQMDLTVTEPPTLAGNTNSARLIFVNSNAGLITNEDSTLSTFSMVTATNFALTSVDSNAFTLYFSGSYFPSQLSFTNNNFILEIPSFSGTYTFSGTNTYNVFSPQGSMVRLDYINDSTNVNIEFMQFNFTSTNSGSFFGTVFDESTNFLFTEQGTFHRN